MTTQTVFSGQDPRTDEEKLAGRVQSIQSIERQQTQEYEDIASEISELADRLSSLTAIYVQITRLLTVLRWAVVQLIFVMQKIDFQPVYITETKGTGKQSVAYFPDRDVFKEIYRKYAPLIPGGLTSL